MTPEAFLKHPEIITYLKCKVSLKLEKAAKTLCFDPAPTAEDKTVADYIKHTQNMLPNNRQKFAVLLLLGEELQSVRAEALVSTTIIELW